MNLYSQIANSGRDLDVRKHTSNIRGRRLADETRLIWDKDLDNWRWAREYSVTGKITKGVVAHTVSASGKWCRVWVLKPHDKPNEGWDCPSEAVWLESLQARQQSWSALPWLLYQKEHGEWATRSELTRVMHVDFQNYYAEIARREEQELAYRLRG